MSPLANLLSRGKESADPSVDVSDLPGIRPTLVARVNLLPPEIAEAERFRREQVLRVAAVAAAVIVVAAMALNASHDVSRAQASVNVAQARATQLSAEVAALSDVPQTATAVQTAETQRSEALGQEVRWSEYLNNLGLLTPDGIQLTGMQVQQSLDQASAAASASAGAKTGGVTSVLGTPGIATVAFTGQAKNNDDIAYFLDALAAQKGNVDPYFTSATAGTDPGSGKPVVTFSVTTTVTQAAESGRYANGVN